MDPPSRRGKPKIVITHGTSDQILPIEASRRQLVPTLINGSYDVLYHEFEGGHAMNPTLVREAFRWLAD